MQETIDRATQALLSRQRSDGSWAGRLTVNPAPSADLLILYRLFNLDIRSIESEIAPPILDEQNPDGGWSAYPGSPSDLDTTAEIALGLSLCKTPPKEALSNAKQFIASQGGIGKTFFTIQLLYCLCEQWSLEKVRKIPMGLIWLPKGIGLESLPSWARVLSLTVMLIGDRGKNSRWANKSRNKTLQILKSLQDRNGSWYGMFTPTFMALLALHRQGYKAIDPSVQWGIRFIRTLQNRAANGIIQERYRAETWNTALAVHTLRTGGLPDDHPAISRGIDYLALQQIWTPSTPPWASKNPSGGWAFEADNTLFPDADDTSAAVLALSDVRNDREAEIYRQMFRGVNWLLRQQNPHGGWGAFDREIRGGMLAWGARNIGRLYNRDKRWMWFCRTRDMATPDNTGHALEAILTGGISMSNHAVGAAVDFLISCQMKSGAWRGRWGVGPIYGTYMALRGLRSTGLPRGYPSVDKALTWLKSKQLPDGGWGEPPESFQDKRLWGAGPSNPTQTGWAILGLVLGGEGESDAVNRGVKYLCDTQQENGFWEEPFPTGVLMPPDCFLSYELYPLIFPLLALIKVSKGKEPTGR